jgi:hypothetical protein
MMALSSVEQLCDSGCDIIFTQDNVEVNKDRNSVMYGVRDQNLKEALTSNCKPACIDAHKTSNWKNLINYLHATAFSPVKSTLIIAIKHRNFASWPGLTEQAVEKHYQNQQQQ